jgi:hypothetical protein
LPEIPTFDPGPGTFILQTPNTIIQGFIVKLNANGQLTWARQIGSTMATVQPRSIACDESGNVYLTSSFVGTADFDPGNSVYNLSTPGNSSNIFISKINTDGTFGFAKHIGDDQFSHAYYISIDKANNIYVSGYFSGSPDFDPESGVHVVNSKGSLDGFVLKLSQCPFPATSDDQC